MTVGINSFGGATRAAGRMARFVNNVPHGDQRAAALPRRHPAVLEGRTIFPSRVVDASDAPRLLVPGFNSSKIGGRIIKGPWSGLHIYTLTLEERATCPTTCLLLSECFGNSSPFSRRHRDDGTMVERLGVELSALLRQHRRGIAVRLHVLGDFPTADYARAWLAWVKVYPRLHVFGFTAWQPGTEIGQLVLGGNKRFSGRWSIRCSVGSTDRIAPMQATTIWRQPEADNVPEGLVCPASTHKADCCGSCSLCWSPAMKAKRIVFIGHGRRTSSGGERAPETLTEKRIAFAGGPAAVARGMGFGVQAIRRWGKTDRVPAASMEAFEALCDDLGRRLTGGTMPSRPATPNAVRQCENMAIDPTDEDFLRAVADIAWTNEHPEDNRAVFLHPDPGSRETWRVFLGHTEVDVLFQPSTKVIVGVAMVKGYAKASARRVSMPAPRMVNAAPVAPKAAPPAKAPPPAPSLKFQIGSTPSLISERKTEVAPPPKPTTGQHGDYWDWTPERDAVLSQRWPTDMPFAEVRALLAALPGKIGSDGVIGVRAVQVLKVRRPEGFVAQPKRVAPREKRAERDARIEQRDDIIRQGYADGLDDLTILDRVRAVDMKLRLGDIASIARYLNVGRPQPVSEGVAVVTIPSPPDEGVRMTRMPLHPGTSTSAPISPSDDNQIAENVAAAAPDVNPDPEIVAAGDSADAPPGFIFAPSNEVEKMKSAEIPQGEGHDGLTLAPATEPAISAPDLQIDASGQRANGSGQRAPEIDPTRSGYRMPSEPIPEHRKNGHAEPAPLAAEPDRFLQMLFDEERWLAARLVGVRASIDHYLSTAPGGDSTDKSRSDLAEQRASD